MPPLGTVLTWTHNFKAKEYIHTPTEQTREAKILKAALHLRRSSVERSWKAARGREKKWDRTCRLSLFWVATTSRNGSTGSDRTAWAV